MGRTREFLTDKERLLLQTEKELENLTPQQKRDFFKDLRRKTTAMMEALAFLADYLPDEQQTQVFTRESFDPLVCNIILLGKDLRQNPRTERHYRLARLFAECGLNVCQYKIQSENPDVSSLVVKTFNEVRQMIWSSIQIEDKRAVVSAECPKCGNEFDTRIDPRAPITRCPECRHKFKVEIETDS